MNANYGLSVIAKKMVSAIVILSLLLIAAGIAYHRSFAFFPFAFGVSLGAGVNVFKVLMLERTVGKTIDMGKKDAENYVRFQYFLRFLITGLVLVLSAITPFIGIWGAAAGIFTMPLAAFYAKSFIGRNNKANDF